LKRKILFSILSLVLVFSLVIPMGCLPKRDATTPTTDAERIAALESKVSQLQSKIASLPESDSTDYSGDINALYDEIDNLSIELDDILVSVDEMLATWEEEQEASNGSSSSGGEVVTTRWTPVASFSVPQEDLAIKNFLWRGTIRDEDSYTLTLEIDNETGSEQPSQVLIISFDPTSNDTSIDIYNTGVYPNPIAGYLTVWGETDFRPSNGEECRSIEFYSDPFTVPAGPSKVSFSFDLYYAE